jgi:hypothetical protein
VAVGLRLAFLSVDPPLLVTTDSISYALPAARLASGEEFGLGLRRTAGYPLFLAAQWRLFGLSDDPVVISQHALGVVTTLLAWALGRVALGRLPGLLAGLAVALSGPQIVYEQYLMSEALFTTLLVLAALAWTLAVKRLQAGPEGERRPAGRWLALTGLLFGLCALTRPIGQVLPWLFPLTVLALPGSWRARLALAARSSLVVGLCFGLVTVPFMLRNLAVGGELTGSSALGKTLFGRITRHDQGLRFDLPPAGPAERDPARVEARALVHKAAESDTSRGSLVHEQLVRQYGYSEAQAYALMRDVALEIILAQPAYYLQSSSRGALELLLGDDESLREHLERIERDRLRRDWEQQGLGWLLPSPVRPEVRWQTLGRASWVARLYMPSEQPLASVRVALFVVGAAAILLVRRWRAALALPLTALAIVTLSAFLDGPVTRFRYPLDPLIAAVAGAGALALSGVVWRMVGGEGRRLSVGVGERTGAEPEAGAGPDPPSPFPKGKGGSRWSGLGRTIESAPGAGAAELRRGQLE